MHSDHLQARQLQLFHVVKADRREQVGREGAAIARLPEQRALQVVHRAPLHSCTTRPQNVSDLVFVEAARAHIVSPTVQRYQVRHSSRRCGPTCCWRGCRPPILHLAISSTQTCHKLPDQVGRHVHSMQIADHELEIY